MLNLDKFDSKIQEISQKFIQISSKLPTLQVLIEKSNSNHKILENTLKTIEELKNEMSLQKSEFQKYKINLLSKITAKTTNFKIQIYQNFIENIKSFLENNLKNQNLEFYAKFQAKYISFINKISELNSAYFIRILKF